MDLREANKHPFHLCTAKSHREEGRLINKHMNYSEHAYIGGSSAPYVTLPFASLGLQARGPETKGARYGR